MKFVPLLLALLLLPVFLGLSDWHFRNTLHAELLASADQALQKAKIVGVKVTSDYLDVTLKGQVTSSWQRLEAERRINDLPGLRVRDGFNQIRITASLSLVRLDGRINVSGVMPEKTKNWILGWLAGVDSSTRDISFNPFAISKIDLNDPQLEQLIKSFFELPGDSIFQLQEKGFHLEGNATKALEQSWIATAADIGLSLQADSDLSFYPSVYHLPGYAPVSDPEERLDSHVPRELRKLLVQFAEGSAKMSGQQQDKVDQLIRLIKSTPKSVEFVLGSYSFNVDQAQQLRQLLVDGGIQKDRLKVVDFSPSSENLRYDRVSATLDNLVEVLVR